MWCFTRLKRNFINKSARICSTIIKKSSDTMTMEYYIRQLR